MEEQADEFPVRDGSAHENGSLAGEPAVLGIVVQDGERFELLQTRAIEQAEDALHERALFVPHARCIEDHLQPCFRLQHRYNRGMQRWRPPSHRHEPRTRSQPHGMELRGCTCGIMEFCYTGMQMYSEREDRKKGSERM